MSLFESKAEIFGWVIAIGMVVVMGVLVFTGPYHKVSKVVAKAQYAAITDKIVTDAKTIGSYSPKVIVAHVGQEIRFENISNADHTVTAFNGAFNSQNINQQGGWPYTPTKAGTFKYYCVYHPLMKGTLIVKP